MCIENYWGNEPGNLEEERTEYTNQVEGYKCDDDASFNVWMRSMSTTERAEVQDPSHANECIEDDRGSVLERLSHKR